MSENENREIVNCVRTLLKTRGHTLSKKEVATLIEGQDVSNPVALTDTIVAELSNRTVVTTAAKRRGKIPTVRLAIDSFVSALPSDVPGRDTALKVLARYVVKPKQKDEDLSVWQERIDAQLSAWQSAEVEAETAAGEVVTETTTEPEVVTATTEYNF